MRLDFIAKELAERNSSRPVRKGVTTRAMGGYEPGTSAAQFTIYFFTTDGALGTSFDGDGVPTSSFGTSKFCQGLLPQADKIIAFGSNSVSIRDCGGSDGAERVSRFGDASDWLKLRGHSYQHFVAVQ